MKRRVPALLFRLGRVGCTALGLSESACKGHVVLACKCLNMLYPGIWLFHFNFSSDFIFIFFKLRTSPLGLAAEACFPVKALKDFEAFDGSRHVASRAFD